MEDMSLSSNCHSAVQLRLQCSGLAQTDTFSQSDPFALVFINGVEIGRTEVIKNTINPRFVKTFEIDYYFEEVQNVIIRVKSCPCAAEYTLYAFPAPAKQQPPLPRAPSRGHQPQIYDEDKPNSLNLRDHDFLGEVRHLGGPRGEVL